VGTLLAAEQKPGSTRTLLRGADGGIVRRTVLPGGLRVISEQVPGVRSVTYGVWVGVGSRDESLRQMGCSHYLEHLLFKGTHRRNALDISAALDAVGGELNAFTAKEYTCFYARVLDADLPLAVDVVSDVVTSALIRREDVDAERGVILEEIAMRDDDPSDAVHDVFSEQVLGDTPLGRPVIGTVESIQALSRATVHGYWRRHYTPERLVVAAAGNVNHAALVRLVRRAFAGLLEGADPAAVPAGPRPETATTRPGAAVRLTHRRTEQANLVLGGLGLSRNDDRRYALSVLNAALGGGMSSRLFQEVREKRGLAYSVYSYNTQYSGAGLFGVYAGCLPGKVEQVIDLCRTQLAEVAHTGITAEELSRGQGQLKGQYVLGLEDTGSRMVRVGKSELVYGELQSVDEALAHIDAVTLDEVRAVAAELLDVAPLLSVIGPFDDERRFAAAVA